jgi:hypothetical protein
MKKIKITLLALAVIGTAVLALAAASEKPSAQNQPISQKELVQRFGFIDENGDGINDLARDDDNDGVPNCLDPDWVGPKDGTGYQNKYGYKHQMANTQNRGSASHFNHDYNYNWNNNFGSCDGTHVCDNSGQGRRSGRNHN